MNEETSTETIQRVLSAYDLGRKIRQLRLRRKIALVDMGKHTGLSPSMLSQLENGKMIPTLPTLARIAMVFDVGMDHFFGDKREKKLFSLVRASERMRFPERPDLPDPAWFFECLTFGTQGEGMKAFLAEFPRREIEQDLEHAHDGTEFLFVLTGALTLRFQGESHQLRAGDSLLMDSSEPHSYRGTGEAGAKAIIVTSPPRP